MNRGDIVIVVAQGDYGKPRPGIVVQADELEQETSSVLICPISSDIRPMRYLRPIVDPTERNGLEVRSQIMTDKINALPRERMRRVIGSLDRSTMMQLNGALMTILGLAASTQP